MTRMFYPLLVALVAVFSAVGAARADYGAIAYSQSTGSIGTAYNCKSLGQAENLALSYCDGDDAQVVTWSSNAYCALALGDDAGACGYGWGRTQAEAECLALQECSRYTTNCYIAQWVFSGN